jgi:hypothetical protein
MYNVDLVRQLCREISHEEDPTKSAELLSLLQAVIKEDQQEIRIRLAFLARKYPVLGSDAHAAD